MSELQHVARTVLTSAPAGPSTDDPSPGKATRVGAGSGSTAGATPLDRVIARAGETVHDDRGFTYVVRVDGSFEVTGTPQQLVRSRGKVITADGPYAARWREVASALVHARPAIELPGPAEQHGGPPSPAAWFRMRYDGVAGGQPLARRLRLYDDFVTVTSIKHMARNELAGDGAAISAGFEAFADALETDLAAELVAAPDGATVWRAFVETHAETIATWPRLAAFRRRAEHQLLEHLASDAVAAAGPRGRELIDVHLRAIVANHRQDFFAAASNGVHGWHLPAGGADEDSAVLAGGGAIASGVGSIFTTELFGGALLAAGIELTVIGIGAGVVLAVMAYQSQKEAQRIDALQAAIRGEMMRGIERVTEGIKRQEDVIAAVIAAEAIKRGIDAGSLAREPLRALAWTQMFADMPADAGGIRGRIEGLMQKYLDPHLHR